MKSETQPFNNTPSESKSTKLKIGVTSGMRGYFPVLYDASDDICEPVQTGFTCKTFKEAQEQAIEWSKAEDVPVDFITNKN